VAVGQVGADHDVRCVHRDLFRDGIGDIEDRTLEVIVTTEARLRLHHSAGEAEPTTCQAQLTKTAFVVFDMSQGACQVPHRPGSLQQHHQRRPETENLVIGVRRDGKSHVTQRSHHSSFG
jgi:hypothetical protein